MRGKIERRLPFLKNTLSLSLPCLPCLSSNFLPFLQKMYSFRLRSLRSSVLSAPLPSKALAPFQLLLQHHDAHDHHEGCCGHAAAEPTTPQERVEARREACGPSLPRRSPRLAQKTGAVETNTVVLSTPNSIILSTPSAPRRSPRLAEKAALARAAAHKKANSKKSTPMFVLLDGKDSVVRTLHF